MRRLFLLIAFILLTLAMLWVLTPKWLPHVIAALLPDTVELQSVDAEMPGRNSWTIRSLHIAYTASDSSPSAQTEPSQLYALVRRGPVDDLNSLLSNYSITIQQLLLTQGNTLWKGSAQLGKGRLTSHLSGELDSHSTQFSADIDLHKRVLDGELGIGDQVQITASIRPSSSTIDGGSESKLEFAVDAAFTDVPFQSGETTQFGVSSPSINDKEAISATSAELHMRGALSYEDETFLLSLDEQSHGLLQNVRSKDFIVPRLRAGLRAPARLTLNDQQLLVAPLRFTSNNLNASYQQTQLPRFRVTGDISLHNSIASGSVHIASRIPGLTEQITVSLPFSHQLDSGVGRATVHNRPIHFSEQQQFLANVIPHWKWPADLIDGNIQLSGQLNWSQASVTAQLNLALNAVGGFYREFLLDGVEGTATMNWPEASANIEMVAEQLNAGMLVNDLTLSAQFTQSNVLINTATLSMFGGKLSTSKVSLNPQNIEFNSVVTLSDVKLGQLLSVEKGIEGSGIVDGQLPIVVSGRTVTMSEGTLTARKPGGVIRYTGTVPLAAIETSPELKLAIEALKNFHYKVLDINASYAENGKMTLVVRLEGRNPDLESSRPINFNLNVTEDIPSLIKSLMLSREISEGLQKRIEQSKR